MTTGTLLLEQFLQFSEIEESPAWEFVEGEIVQKPMSAGKHSRLQYRLVDAINAASQKYEAFPELRCTFAGRSIVPDIAVISAKDIPVDENGEIISTGLEIFPNWVIEILSPEQNKMRVTRKLLHCLSCGCQLAWLIDPSERVVLLFRAATLPIELTKQSPLCKTYANLNLLFTSCFNVVS